MTKGWEKNLARLTARSTRRSRAQTAMLETSVTCKGMKSHKDQLYIQVAQRRLFDDKASKPPHSLVRIQDLADIERFNRRLSEAGIFLPYAQQQEAARLQAASIKNFTSANLLERPGYDGAFFGLRSGKYLVVKGGPPDEENSETEGAIVAYGDAARYSRSSGTRKEHLDGLARLLEGQDLLTFSLCVALAPLLLRFTSVPSFGIELCGAAAYGKSAAIELAAACWGAPWEGYEIENAELFNFVSADDSLERCQGPPPLSRRC